MATTIGNYVKFLRGTPAAWAALVNPNPDTLYFIAETNATTGKLYLGSKLISGGDTETSVTSLADLEDVLISNNIPNSALLVYDGTDHKWKPLSLSTVFSLMVSPMTGATATTNGAQGLVPAPQAGDLNKYLSGAGTWQDPTATISAVVTNLIGTDVGKSIRTIAAEETAKIVDGAPAAYDTLVEIANWISNNSDAADIVALDNRVDRLENTIYGQDGTGTTDGLIVDVSNLTTNYSSLSTLVDSIDETVRWQDMIEE